MSILIERETSAGSAGARRATRDPRKVKILMRLPYGRNVATRQAVHGSAP